MHILDIELVTAEITERIDKRCLACPDGLYLGAGQHKARLKGLDELIVKRSPSILDLYTTFCFRHNIVFVDR
jgi:hypothetical protein